MFFENFLENGLTVNLGWCNNGFSGEEKNSPRKSHKVKNRKDLKMSRSLDPQNLLVFTPDMDERYEGEIENAVEELAEKGYESSEINYMLCEKPERLFNYWFVVSDATEQKVAELLPAYEKAMGEDYDEDWAKKDALVLIDDCYIYDEDSGAYLLGGGLNVDEEIGKRIVEK